MPVLCLPLARCRNPSAFANILVTAAHDPVGSLCHSPVAELGSVPRSACGLTGCPMASAAPQQSGGFPPGRLHSRASRQGA